MKRNTLFHIGDTVLFDGIECEVLRVFIADIGANYGAEMIEFQAVEPNDIWIPGTTLIRRADIFHF